LDQLCYFGASVFWRASVHRWAGEFYIDFGSVYNEQFRRFLMGEVGFPEDASGDEEIPAGRCRATNAGQAIPRRLAACEGSRLSSFNRRGFQITVEPVEGIRLHCPVELVAPVIVDGRYRSAAFARLNVSAIIASARCISGSVERGSSLQLSTIVGAGARNARISGKSKSFGNSAT
jgi:hypothetical protein